MHRMMTLGHIVATTSVRLNFLKKRKQFDGDNFLNKNGVQMIKNIAKSYKVGEPHFQCLFSLLSNKGTKTLSNQIRKFMLILQKITFKSRLKTYSKIVTLEEEIAKKQAVVDQTNKKLKLKKNNLNGLFFSAEWSGGSDDDGRFG